MKDTRKGKSIWRPFLLLIPLAIVLALGSFLYIRSRVSVFTVYGWTERTDQFFSADNIRFDHPDVLEVVEADLTSFDRIHVVLRAVNDGKTIMTATTGGQEGDAGAETEYFFFTVRNGTIFENGINFSGWEAVQLSLIIFMAAVCALFALVFARLLREARYGFAMIACGGGMLFTLFQLVILAFMAFTGGFISFESLVQSLTWMADLFFILSIPPSLIVALLVSISNISLIRHEGFRPVNLLGIISSVLWIIIIAFRIALSARLPQDNTLVVDVLETLVGAAIAFGECLFISTAVVGWLAAIHVPEHGADYLIVLGCGLMPDGTPCPLLAGRVDRALEFDEARAAAGDKPATFVPSGGQGPDEVISEAQSMGAYLEGKAVDRERIVLENRSSTTRENMAFSRKVIEDHAGRDVSELSVVFSTTNYHVLRGYTCAQEAGMIVEGVGSKTKLYFWPNAALREFAGLLVAQRRSIFQTYLAIAGVFVLAEIIVG